VGPELPPEEIFDTWQLREVSDIFAEAVAFQCDTLVYAGEAHTIAAFNNGVTVVEHFLSPGGHSDPQRAGELLNDLATARLRRFESLAFREIPAMLQHHDASAAQREALATLLRWMRYIIGAAHEWLRRRQAAGTGLRLPLPTQPRQTAAALPTGPTGLGTSTLRLA
jgi:germacradienol/geosmin synthase